VPYRATGSGTSSSKGPYPFTGQEYDDELGFYNYKARLYDPEIGRFITPDSIVPRPDDPQSLNRCTYARNNPLFYYDPNGHEEDGDGVYGSDDPHCTPPDQSPDSIPTDPQNPNENPGRNNPSPESEQETEGKRSEEASILHGMIEAAKTIARHLGLIKKGATSPSEGAIIGGVVGTVMGSAIGGTIAGNPGRVAGGILLGYAGAKAGGAIQNAFSASPQATPSIGEARGGGGGGLELLMGAVEGLGELETLC